MQLPAVGRTILCGSLFILYILQIETVNAFVLDYFFFKDVYIVNSLGMRDSVTLWNKEQVCLKPCKTEMMSPYGTWSGVLTVQYRRFRFPVSRVPLLQCNPLRVPLSSGSLHIILWELGLKELTQICLYSCCLLCSK